MARAVSSPLAMCFFTEPLPRKGMETASKNDNMGLCLVASVGLGIKESLEALIYKIFSPNSPNFSFTITKRSGQRREMQASVHFKWLFFYSPFSLYPLLILVEGIRKRILGARTEVTLAPFAAKLSLEFAISSKAT